jgi:arylsulfatase A-like enzyme/Tfp pilus assembly protein PilF
MRTASVLLLCTALASCSREGARPSALLITLDTTRADALGCFGNRTQGVSPNLDALTQRGILYVNAHSVAPLTLPAHASILTGLVPPRHGIRNNGPWLLPRSARTLAEAAREAGHQTAAFVAAVVLDRAFALDQGFETYSGPAGAAAVGHYEVASLSAREIIDRAIAWLAVRDPARPFFLWIHLFEPHQPYTPPPEFMTPDMGTDTYLGEIAAMDHEIGRLLGHLQEKALLASTAILVVADHGEALGEKGEETHGVLCYEQSLHVPFILARPDGARAGERSRAQVSVADVAPTLAEAMGVALADGLDGVSLWSGDPPATRGVYFESYMGYLELAASPLAGWIDAGGKYLESSAPEFYRLDSDPLEEVSDLEAADLEHYRAAMAGVLARPPLEPEESALDESLLAGIRALGYAAGASQAALPNPLEASTRPSPREMVGELAELVRAAGLVDAGKHEEALAIVRPIVAAHPEMVRALALEASCLIALGRNREAIEPLRRYLELAPGRAVEYYNLGVCLKSAGRTEEAIASFERALELEPARPVWLPAFAAYLRQSGREADAAALEARSREN